MSATAGPLRDPARTRRDDPSDSPPEVGEHAVRSDDWPHTKRVMPWLIALFLLMVYWVPFDSITVPISLPINSDLDRFVIGFMVVVWIVLGSCSPGAVRLPHAPINVAIFVFITIAIASIALNLRQLAWDGELMLSIKQLSLIGSYCLAFLCTATTVRRSEVPGYAKLLVGLGVGTALGTVYQYQTGTNPFFSIASVVFVGLHVTSPASGIAALVGPGARPSITGPTLHGLADATLMSTAVPFSICLATVARQRREKAMWIAALMILLAGCFATGRKTALVVCAVSFLVLFAYKPRTYLPYLAAPLAAGLVLFVTVPTAVHRLIETVTGASSSTSTAGRLSDYAAVIPDIVSHLLIGRGYGSYDPFKYRILDDQMLGWLVEVGVIGALAYAAMILTAVVTVHNVARAPRRSDDHLMRAVAAAAVGFLITNFLYDTFGFRQAPYCFFFVAALGAAYCGTRSNYPDPKTPRSDA